MIKKLPQNIISRIAAGEVVERPVNIIKELVENSIDAEATKITITIENGGLDMVQVVDNGTGIPADEIKLAFELHTTSKVNDADISSITSLGFRGEALNSIASVSRVECKSKQQDKPGYRVLIEGGKVVEEGPVSCSDGTSIRVTAIFFNIPARRKFLKTAATERKHILSLLTHISLLYPHIHIILEEKENNRIKRRLESPARKSMLAAVYDVLGAEIAGSLIPLKGQINQWSINGYISEPSLTRKDRSMQFICVNGRAIKHPELQQIIEKAYGSQLMKQAHPVLILELDGPSNQIDFNVHPQKSEIRFKTDDPILDELHDLVQKTLDKTWDLPKLSRKKIHNIPQKDKSTDNKAIENIFTPASELPINETKMINEESLKFPTEVVKPDKPKKVQTRFVDADLSISNDTPIEQTEPEIKSPDKKIHDSTKYLDRSALIVGDKKILGQIMQKFAIIDAGNELWLMDIHAADERVKFEKYQKRRDRKIFSQQFLQPMSVDLSTMEKQTLLDNHELLKKFGFTISDGGGNKILVHSIPVHYTRKFQQTEAKELLLEFYTFLDNPEVDTILQESFDKMEYGIVARLSCHGAIRSGYNVSQEVIAEVLTNLLKCDNPWTCAHGRPTIMRISESKLNGWFKR